MNGSNSEIPVSESPSRGSTRSQRLATVLDRLTVPGELWHPEGERIRCVACGHRCLVAPGRRGICKVRFNEEGKLRVPFGYVSGLQCDPVEKKPFFHLYPGSDALTFGMMGCDLHCSYCQNWITSQALRDEASEAAVQEVSATGLVRVALRNRARLVVSSYNEPLITGEWAASVFKEAVAAGLSCAFVSNGNATPEALNYIGPLLKAYKVDLKSFNDRRYRTLGCTLQQVLDTIRLVHARGLWIEVVTLLIPGFNDDRAEVRDTARFLASVSRDIPWHVTAFHPNYRLTSPPRTAVDQLIAAAEVGAEEGLRFVYAGNAPGQVGRWENTYCPACQRELIGRYGFIIRRYELTPQGHCPDCNARIPGIWPGPGEGPALTSGSLPDYVQRLPRRVFP
jgi:pyruvate formate lyase activating enzyme